MLDLRAILFDFDGVLADTAADNLAAWNYALEPFGVQIQARDYLLREGTILQRLATGFLELYGTDTAHAPEVVSRREEWSRKYHTPKLFPDAVNIVKQITALGLKTALVSAASRERLNHPSLSKLRAALSAIISSQDCKEGKPSPEPYLLGAKELGIEPKDCLVVENAPFGVRAAKSAGMTCVAITTTVSAEDLSQADYILSSLSELSGLITKLKH